MSYENRSPQPGDLVMPTPEGRLRCDFCTREDVRWTYPARDFTEKVAGRTVGSQGGWAACDPCHDLIEADDYDGLATRGEGVQFIDGRAPREFVEWIVQRHGNFRANRLGPAVRCGPEDQQDPTRAPTDSLVDGSTRLRVR